MKRLLIWLGGALLLAGALLFITGLTLPRGHRARSCITLAQPAESLWAVTRDIGGTVAWWPDLKHAERVDSGGVERWRETANDFTMTLRVEEIQPGVEFRTIIEAGPDAAFGGRWIYRLGSSPAGQTVCITEEGWVSNPAFRALANLMGMHRTLDSYLTALATRFGTSYLPEHLD